MQISESDTRAETSAGRVAVLLPCFNEAMTIGKVVRDFRNALPRADIYVFDNCSDDDTARIAAEAGALVIRTPRRGKGHVVRQMFRDVDADIYVMADGDDTYPAGLAASMINVLIESGADMVVGNRLGYENSRAFRPFHALGNRLISRVISFLFASHVTDVLSGYRVFTDRFVKSMRLRSPGFEIEAEITLQALVEDRVVKEVSIPYGSRPAGSVSKLNTWSDGLLIFNVILLIFRDYKPLQFFAILSGLCFVVGLAAGWYPLSDYATTRFVSHVPLALLAAALEILAALFLGIGLILNSIRKYHVETRESVAKLYELLDTRRRRT